MDIATPRRRRYLDWDFYILGRAVAIATYSRRYCDEMTATGKKTLFRGNIHAFPWILPHFAVAKLITCTSGPRMQPQSVDL